MQRAAMYEEGPPPSYESVVSAAPVAAALGSPFDAPLDPPFVPPRYLRPTGGRNSIRYSELAPLFDTTRVYLVDNKSTDVASLNYQNDHSNFLTTVIQNNDYSPGEASTQTINLDDRSHWGGDLKTILHTNMPNVNEFMFTNKFKARVMVSRSLTKDKQVELKYEWVEFTLPEGNYSETMTIDLMNNAIVEHYLKVGRQNGVLESDIGVKFDTRNFRLGFDPVTGLVMPGVYTNEAFHPDIILLPGCGVDFTHSRLSNLLGIRKRQPFQEGFRITYDDLEGGNIPALLDVDAYQASLKDDTEQGGDGAGGGNNSGSGAEENSNAAAAAMQPVEDMNDHAIRGDTFATRAEANQAVQNKINSKLDPRPPVEEPPPAVETVSPEGRGEKRPRPDREETLVTQIDEPPSYEEALKQGLPTTRPIAPMATGVLGQHTPVTLDLPPPADTQQKPVLPGPSAVVVTRPSRASLRRAASGPRSTL